MKEESYSAPQAQDMTPTAEAPSVSECTCYIEPSYGESSLMTIVRCAYCLRLWAVNYSLREQLRETNEAYKLVFNENGEAAIMVAELKKRCATIGTYMLDLCDRYTFKMDVKRAIRFGVMELCREPEPSTESTKSPSPEAQK